MTKELAKIRGFWPEAGNTKLHKYFLMRLFDDKVVLRSEDAQNSSSRS